MAITNFAHMKPWKNSYDDLCLFEDAVLEDNVSGNKAKKHYIDAIADIRNVLERMLQEMVELNGISDSKLSEVQEKKKAKNKRDVIVYISALEECECISKTSADNLHKLRIFGNRAHHKTKEVSKDIPYEQKSPEELKRIAEKEVYPRLYRETYLFANQYIPEAKSRKSTRVTTGANSSGKVAASGGDRKVASGPSATDIILAAVKIFFVLLVTTIMIAMMMNFPF